MSERRECSRSIGIHQCIPHMAGLGCCVTLVCSGCCSCLSTVPRKMWVMAYGDRQGYLTEVLKALLPS